MCPPGILAEGFTKGRFHPRFAKGLRFVELKVQHVSYKYCCSENHKHTRHPKNLLIFHTSLLREQTLSLFCYAYASNVGVGFVRLSIQVIFYHLIMSSFIMFMINYNMLG